MEKDKHDIISEIFIEPVEDDVRPEYQTDDGIIHLTGKVSRTQNVSYDLNNIKEGYIGEDGMIHLRKNDTNTRATSGTNTSLGDGELIQSLREQLIRLKDENENLKKQNENLQNDNVDVVQQTDLIDYESIIADLNAQITQLQASSQSNESLENIGEIIEEKNRAIEEKNKAIDALTSFMEEQYVVSLPELSTMGQMSAEKIERLNRYQAFSDEFNINALNGEILITSSRLDDLVEELEAKEEEIKSIEQRLDVIKKDICEKTEEEVDLKKQITDFEKDNGELFDELKTLNERYHQDLKYAAFYHGISTNKIDGLEVFRKQLLDLEIELDQIMEDGLKKSYILKNNELLKSISESKKIMMSHLNELKDTIAEYDMPIDSSFTAYSTEHYKEIAKKTLEKYEDKIRDIYVLTEKFLVIKNALGLMEEA